MNYTNKEKIYFSFFIFLSFCFYTFLSSEYSFATGRNNSFRQQLIAKLRNYQREKNIALLKENDTVKTIVVDGIQREYILHTPPEIDSKYKYPVIFFLHGGYGNMYRATKYGFSKFADENKFLIVYPNGLEGHWNDGRGTTHKKVFPNDVLFFKKIIQDLAGFSTKINTARLFIAGISNGGLMSFKMACEESKLFRGIATVVANLPKNLIETCKPKKSIALMTINGLGDPLVPFHGGSIGKNHGAVASFSDTLKIFLKVNECVGPTKVRKLPTLVDDGTSVSLATFQNCKEPITSFLIAGGGHGWPPSTPYNSTALWQIL